MNVQLGWFIAVFVSVVVTAALVNWLAPVHRPRLRRALVLFALAVLTLGIAELLFETHNVAWSGYLEISSEVLRTFVLVNAGALVVFSVLLPRVGLALPMIAAELVAGVGYIVSVFGVLSRHDLSLSGVLATGAVVSAVLAISMQQTLGNILGGIALQLDGSLHEGNWIQFDNGKQGRIRAIRWRHSIVETRDFQTIVVPNAWLLANNIMILGLREGKPVPLRCWAYFNIDFRYSPTLVCNAIEDALRGSPIANVADDPPPVCLCMDFGKDGHESVTTYGVQYYQVDIGKNDSTGSRVRKRIYAALERAQIPLAIPAVKQLNEAHDAEHEQRKRKREDAAHFSAIKTVGLLRSLEDTELHTLADGLTYAPFLDGEVITRQGAVAHYLYILTSGRADIRTRIEGGPTKTVATLSAPDFFGEMGMITGEPRTADVVAVTDVECYRLDKATFEQVLLARPHIAVELSEKLAARRAELAGVRENLDAAARRAREESERQRILVGIRSFFGV